MKTLNTLALACTMLACATLAHAEPQVTYSFSNEAACQLATLPNPAGIACLPDFVLGLADTDLKTTAFNVWILFTDATGQSQTRNALVTATAGTNAGSPAMLANVTFRQLGPYTDMSVLALPLAVNGKPAFVRLSN